MISFFVLQRTRVSDRHTQGQNFDSQNLGNISLKELVGTISNKRHNNLVDFAYACIHLSIAFHILTRGKMSKDTTNKETVVNIYRSKVAIK